MTWDNNVNRSIDGSGEKSDFIIEPSVRAEQQSPLADLTFGFASVELSGAVHGKYDGLNYLAPGVRAGIRQQLDEGAHAPSITAGLALKYEFHDQDFRFGAEFNPWIEAKAHVGDQFSAALYYEYDNRFASDNPIYDRTGHTLGVDTELAVGEESTILMGYRYRKGDALVHQPRTDLGEEIRGERFPLDTFGSRYDAVKLDDATTHRVHIGLRYAVSLYTSIRLEYAYEQIKGEGDKYPSSQFIIGLTHLL